MWMARLVELQQWTCFRKLTFNGLCSEELLERL
jgi:hypothetical protein